MPWDRNKQPINFVKGETPKHHRKKAKRDPRRKPKVK